jgi:Uma2 family endonuclease
MATETRTRKPRPRQLPPASSTLPIYRFSVEQYHQMIDAGVLRSGDKCELLEGWITAKMTQNRPHATAVRRIHRWLSRTLRDDWVICVQTPIALRQSEPEPDLSIVKGPEERYTTRHPGAQDVGLVIEVADASLEQDRGPKLRLYARSRIPSYWIVNLLEHHIEVYTDPRAGRSPNYRRRQDYSPGDSISLTLGGQSFGAIPVRDLLP